VGLVYSPGPTRGIQLKQTTEPTLSRSNFSVTSCDQAMKCRALQRDLTSRSSAVDASPPPTGPGPPPLTDWVVVASRITAALPPYRPHSTVSSEQTLNTPAAWLQLAAARAWWPSIRSISCSASNTSRSCTRHKSRPLTPSEYNVDSRSAER